MTVLTKILLSWPQLEPDASVPVAPVIEPQSTPTVDPRMAHTVHTSIATATTSVAAVDQHATLLALLTQAAVNTALPTQ